MVRLGLVIIWLLHFLPYPLLALIGETLGMMFYLFGIERRRVAAINLRLCFPELPSKQRNALLRKHFRAFGRSVVERSLQWWAPIRRIENLVKVEGLENWHAVKDQPVILFVPHFVGLDFGGTRLTRDIPIVSIYSQQKNKRFNDVMLRGRLRFGTVKLYSRQDGVKPVIKEMKQGMAFYYLPDMDFGPRDSIFVPFFGVSAATIPGLSRLAKIAGAVVIPCVTRQLPGYRGYTVKLYPAWENFPTEDIAQDTRRMNEFIEQRIQEIPEQYFWLHKRFKTRPSGEQRFYR